MSGTEPEIRIVEDDPIMGESLVDRLTFEGFRTCLLTSAADALEVADTRPPAGAWLVDIKLPDMSGEVLYEKLIERTSVLPPTLFMTGYASVEQAVRLLKLGATDYLPKPVEIEELVTRLHRLCRNHGRMDRGEAVLGVSRPMQAIEDLLHRLAGHRDTPVLITGESGAGKEEVARHLHELESPDQPFIAVNCTAVAEGLLESELFGHERGAFTGASRTHRGVFERASGGTLFLDEIGDMPLAMQGKLLRAIQERRITRVGAEQSMPVDLRLQCATHQDLGALLAESRFREDLYYRINVLEVPVPPLRERPDDVAWLANRFLAEHGRRYPGDAKTLSEEARAALMRHEWPGNVRELKHALERACILCHGSRIQDDDLGTAIQPAEQGSDRTLESRLEQTERSHILASLYEHQWRITATAKALGISRKTLWQRMRRLGIDKASASKG